MSKFIFILSRQVVFALIFCALPAASLLAQLTVSGGHVVVDAGCSVVATGLSVQNNDGATISNAGVLATTANITNNSGASLNGNGFWQLGGNWTNAGTFAAGNSTVLFNGNGPSMVAAGGDAFHHLQLNKNANDLTLASDVLANGIVSFLANNNKINCLGFDFTLGDAASIVGADEDDYFVTAGAGMVKRQGLGADGFLFPVGADNSTYNPVILSENGAVDEIAVRCLPQPLANGLSGAPISADVANTAWEITEALSGGSDLSMTAYWDAADELGGFDRTSCGIARSNTGTDWDLPVANLGAATGGGPYARVRNNLNPGILAVMDDAFLDRVRLAVKIMLQGPFNTTTMQMNDKLRLLAGFPLTPPASYGAGKFLFVGWQPNGGYSIDASVLSVTGDDAIVDWVFVWLKDENSPATNIQSRVALLQKDGDVVDLDGASPVGFPVSAGDYLVAVGHRNHLSVRMPNGAGISLSEATVASYDFTTNMSQAYGNNPMKEVQQSPTSIFALWGGNTSLNNSVRATGPPSINDYSVILSTLGFPTNIIQNTYSNSDVNMDGTVRATGPPTINDYSKLLNILGTPTNIINEQQ